MKTELFLFGKFFFALVILFQIFFMESVYSQEEENELVVRTMNTHWSDPYYSLRLRGIAQKFYSDLSNQIGLIGLQEVKGEMTDCKTGNTHTNGAKCLAAELADLFSGNSSGLYSAGNQTGIVVDDNWKIIEKEYWELGWLQKRYLIEVLLEHKKNGYKLRFYSTHLSNNNEPEWWEFFWYRSKKDKGQKKRAQQSKKLVKKVLRRAKTGELPPIVVGDFNSSRKYETGEAEKSVKVMEKHFWRPVDDYPSNRGYVDIIYIGKKSSFSYRNGYYKPIEPLFIEMAHISDTVDGQQLEELSDHHNHGFRLSIKQAPYIVWWEDKEFRGTSHKRVLHPSDYGKCLDLVHNDKMKSIKFYGIPGSKLYIYDEGNCRTKDDWGVITFPNNSIISVVEIPLIGKQGPSSCNPPGTYEFHYHNGLPGEVSAIKFTYEGTTFGYNYKGIIGYIYTSQIPGTVPLYMLYNSHAGDHFYTISPNGANPIGDWQPKKIIGYVYSESGQTDRLPLYRWYKSKPNKPKKTDHFYTTTSNEPTSGSGYSFERIECYVPKSNISGTVPFLRWYKKSINDHFYTRSTHEPTEGSGYEYEVIQCNIFPNQSPGTVPLYRLYSKQAGDHFYTISSDGLGSIGSWDPEGIAGWVYSGPVSSHRQPLYRWYKQSSDKPIKTDHFYTTSTSEPTSNSGYEFERIECYLPIRGSVGCVPLYRYYNPTLNDNYYTTNPPNNN